MKQYPSIRQSRKSFQAYVFDKLDGSNLRFSWNRRQGWYEYATRTRNLPIDHKLYKIGYEYFFNVYADIIVATAKKKGWKRLDAFCEFHGDNSFAGRHDLSEQQRVTLIDLAPNTRGFLNPEEFLDLFSTVPLPKYLGQVEWNEDYIDAVRQGLIEGITFEGVVAKSATKQRMAKAKTQAWIDRIMQEFGEVEGAKIIKS
ncbi:hypothetical protein IQ249_22540 [Lusitaniella coriacea LEGE 07157]|uniref:RNA ligase domain-containing protein n=1 Tax=Lusitaniella coriacea LEGE 07157 TaxID=945747 RepID=A0A8J7DZP6_9CYAN|nr:RNA ligase family protein [Lusitaniella coriacea]MBE9118672.1 hypothetical protein [Lusitaniella coriacea LEGE 07157]